MEDKEIERLSEELRDVEVPAELDIEDILKEDFGDAPQDPEPAPEPAAEEPEAPAVPEPESAAAEEPFELPAELSDEAAEEEFPRDDEDLPSGEKRPGERRRRELPELSNETLFLLAGMALSAVLAAIAVALGLEKTAWRVMMTLSLIVGCAPMALGCLDIVKDRSRVPAPLIMIAACVLTALCGGVVEAVITAVIFNLLYAVLEAFTGHELHIVYDRLEAELDGLGEAERTRVSNQLREIAGRRLQPIVRERALDRLILLGLLAFGAFLCVVPPLVSKAGFAVWIGRAAALLAVGLYAGDSATLMSTLNAVDSCVSAGIFFSGNGAMEATAEVTSVLFNKSGTLTDGEYRVVGTDPVRISEEQLLFLAVYAGAWSNHPLDKAVRFHAGYAPDRTRVERHQERAGYGSVVQLDGRQIVAVGNIDLMEELGVKGDMYIPGETCLFVAVGKTCVGRIDFADALRPEAAGTVNELRRQRVANVALMTGDNALNATNVGRRLGITEIYSDCRPADKVSRLQYILDTQERDDRLAFVGSGNVDRELMEMANIGVSMGLFQGDNGTTPDLVITSEKLTTLPAAISIARAVRRNAFVSFVVSAAVRILTAILSVTGVLSLWSAVTIVLLLQAGLFFNTRVPDER